jgi:hypothetical protein
MRVLIIVLLLVLTPLRGWAADSMAVQMATQGMGSGPSDHEGHTAHEAPVSLADPAIHCAGMADHHADAATPNGDEDSVHGGEPCSNCAACQVCATVALIAPPRVNATSPQVHHLPWVALPSFSDAELAPSQKPPIS